MILMKTRVLGIDPGLLETGWGVVEIAGQRLQYIASGVIKTSSTAALSNRLLHIHNNIQQIVIEFMPQAAAIEDTYVNNNFGSSLKLSHARAAAILSLAINNIAAAEYPAKTVKKSLVGNGNADKEQVQAMLALLLKGLVIKNNNEADAIAVAICHAHHI